jgi:hypothetical protein
MKGVFANKKIQQLYTPDCSGYPGKDLCRACAGVAAKSGTTANKK